ncbi:MAG: helix-turn-helix transcriptional regulator [Acidovorax sp.]|nr:helix-turn-helix transcriptional regulator [Acidovorax sp.]
MQENEAVRSLAALAQEVRLRVFRALVVAGQAGLTPGALCEQLGIAPNTLSFHLKELTHAGLVSQERQGRNLIYRASFTAMASLMAYLTENCCQGAPCAADDAAPAVRVLSPRPACTALLDDLLFDRWPA